MVLVTTIVLREIYRPLILDQRLRRLRKQTGNQALVSVMPLPASGIQALARSVIRPARLLVLSPISIGATLACIGMLIYGWGMGKGVHWMVPILGTAIFNMRIIALMLPVSAYVIEVFRQYAAAPIGAYAVFRFDGGRRPASVCEQALREPWCGMGKHTAGVDRVGPSSTTTALLSLRRNAEDKIPNQQILNMFSDPAKAKWQDLSHSTCLCNAMAQVVEEAKVPYRHLRFCRIPACNSSNFLHSRSQK
jgi:hypothetical protein